jgi:hypothetical protein
MKLFSFIAVLAIVAAVPKARTEPITYVCDYKAYSDEDGLHRVTTPFVLTFLFDTATAKAYMVGNNGSSDLQSFPQRDGITLVEVTGAGNVMVTAITSDGESVHSRTGILAGKIVPSQYYGACRRQ